MIYQFTSLRNSDIQLYSNQSGQSGLLSVKD